MKANQFIELDNINIVKGLALLGGGVCVGDVPSFKALEQIQQRPKGSNQWALCLNMLAVVGSRKFLWPFTFVPNTRGKLYVGIAYSWLA